MPRAPRRPGPGPTGCAAASRGRATRRRVFAAYSSCGGCRPRRRVAGGGDLGLRPRHRPGPRNSGVARRACSCRRGSRPTRQRRVVSVDSHGNRPSGAAATPLSYSLDPPRSTVRPSSRSRGLRGRAPASSRVANDAAILVATGCGGRRVAQRPQVRGRVQWFARLAVGGTGVSFGGPRSAPRLEASPEWKGEATALEGVGDELGLAGGGRGRSLAAAPWPLPCPRIRSSDRGVVDLGERNAEHLGDGDSCNLLAPATPPRERATSRRTIGPRGSRRR